MTKKQRKKKKLSKEEQQKKDLQIYKLSFFLVYSLLVIILGLLFFVLYQMSLDLGYIEKNKNNNSEIVQIQYINMTEDEISHFQKVFADIDPIYLTRNKNFVVRKGVIDEDPSCGGINRNDGEEIELKYLPYTRVMRKTICHELLHSYFYGDGGDREENPVHEIIYQLGNKEVCFQSSFDISSFLD